MTGTIISGSHTTGIVLTSTGSNPVSVTGRISVSSGIALEGTPGAAFTWSVANSGTIISTAISPVSTALFLGAYTTSISSGSVVNESTGYISGSGYGVFVNAATGASVINDAGGTIAGGTFKAVYISGGLGTIVNGGVLLGGNVAIYEYEGGTVTNLSTGKITGNGGVWLQEVGTITNAGTITSTNAGRGAIVLNSNIGSSRVIVDPGAVFNGNIQSLAGGTNVIELASSASAGTLAGFNGTTITNFATLQFDAGAKWTVSGNSLAAGLGSIDITGFAANDTIDLTGFVAISETFGTNAVTLTNAATQHATLHIAGTTFSSANFQFHSDGSGGTDLYVGAASLGHTLSSTYTTAITLASPANNPFTITSVGEAAPTAANATALYAPGGAAWAITNAGTVIGGTSLGTGIELGAAGNYVSGTTVTNQTGGKITGAYGIRMYNSAASSVVNQVGATIAATELSGVYIGGTSVGTVTNAGVISAPIGDYAVLLATESTGNRVIADPGAVFTGKIGGGGGALELASAAGAGTLAGFGTSITNFRSLQFDTGAAWTVAGNDSGDGFANTTITGFAANDTIDLTGFVAVSDSFGSNVVTFTDSDEAQATLNIQGSFSSANLQFVSDGSGGTDIYPGASPLHYGRTIDQAGTVVASETVTAGVMTLENSGTTAVGTILVGGSLSTGDFILRPDGAGGTDVILNTVFGTYTNGVTLLVNPTTIATAAQVSNASNSDAASAAAAVYGSADQYWTLTNQGTVTATGVQGNGVYLKGGGLVINSLGGTISGHEYGVDSYLAATVENSGTILGTAGGAIVLYAGTVVNSGLLAGGSGLGIGIYLAASVTNLSGGMITAATGYGIHLDHTGSVTNDGTVKGATAAILGHGVLTVANTGVIQGTGTASEGVVLHAGGLVTNGSGGTISGVKYGVSANAAGTVENGGVILATGTASIGVNLQGGGFVTNSIGGTISGGEYGVASFLAGTVENSGAILGTVRAAVSMYAGSVVNTGLIAGQGDGSGIYIYRNGIVTNLSGGTITATTGAGIFVHAGDGSAGASSITNDATIEAGSVAIYGRGELTVTNTGIILGTGTDSTGVNLDDGGFVTNSSGGTISGGAYGIYAGAAATVDNSGTILGTATAAVSLYTGTVANAGLIADGGFGAGIYIYQSGIVTNMSGGTITAASGDGILFDGTGNVANDGMLKAGASAIYARGVITVTNTGVILGTGTQGVGVYLDVGGLITNSGSGTISGYGYAIVSDGAGTVENAGTILGTAAGGISLYAGTVVNSGLIADGGAGDGIFVFKNGSVTNQSVGTITAATGDGISVNGTGNVTNDGTVAGGALAIYGKGVLTVTNTGVILSTSTVGTAVYLATGGYVSNSGTGVIAGSNRGVFALAGASTVVNSGTIQGTAGAAISLFEGTVVNANLITSSSGDAVYVYIGGAGSVTNQVGGTITAASGQAIHIDDSGNVTNAGTIGGAVAGIYGATSLTVANTGVILGTAIGSTAVTLAAGGYVTNSLSGTISGGRYGILIGDAAGTVVNSGLVQATASEAVSLDVGTVMNYGAIVNLANGGGVYLRTGTVINSGSIGAGSIAGAIYIYGNGSVTNLSTGTIAGGYGVGFSGGYADTVNNAGTIIGNAGPAVYFQTGGTNLLIDNPSAVFTGAIYGGRSDTAVMELASAASAGAISGFGGTVTNFTSLVFDPGAQWTVGGNNSANGLGTLGISGFTIGDTIDLTGFVAVSDTFASNVLVLTNGSNAHETLNIQGSFANQDFLLAGDDNGGTDITLGAAVAPVIAGTTAGQVTSGATPIDPFASVSITDPNVGQTETVTITQSGTANGSLSDLGGGIYSDGTYSITGSASAVSSAIDALVFTPTGHDMTPGGTVVTGFTIAVTDTAALSSTDSTTTVDGSIYQEATAALLPINEIVHVGDPGTAFLSVSNSDPDDLYSESLIATLLSVTGDIGIAAGGPTGDIAAGATNTNSLSVSFSTALAGTISGTGTIGLTSDGGTGIDSIDGLGQTTLSDQTVAINVVVDNYAVAELTSGGNLTSNGLGSNAFTLNLGTAVEGATALSADFDVTNDVVGSADWLSGSLAASGSGQFSNSGLGAFGTINAGGSLDPGVTLATNQLGTFEEAIVLTSMDTNADDFSQAITAQTIDVTGTIVPTGVAQGDVHMVTFDGLHYDFQADGSYVLTRSTVPGDDFQTQIRTAPDAANHAVSYTTEAAAQVGSDVVTFAIDRASTIWIDGTPDTALSAADPVQTFAGGQLQELSAGNFLLTWTTGQTLSITDQGSHLDSSVGLGAANGPGSVQGLLGSDSGQANDFQLPDGTVLARPLSGGELYGAFADAWSVTPANSLLDAPATTGGHNPTVVPVAVGTTSAGTMQFIYPGGAGGQTVLAADASGQVLSAAAGADVLSDAGGLGVTFQGTLAQFADELISGFSAKDMIDITDLDSATAAVSYAGSGSAGVLHLTDGTLSGELYLAGQLAGGSFRVSSDAHGGTQIAFS